MINRRYLPIAAACLILTACDDWDWGNTDRYKEDFSYTHALQPGGRISVENMNGSVEVLAWDQNNVEITGTKYASTEQVLKAMKIDIAASGDYVRVRTVAPSGYRSGHGARYVIRVPRRVEIERIASSNGRIQVDGIEGSARLRTSNGTVRALRLRGALEVETSNATVEVTSHSGPAVVRTSNGAVRADGVRGHFEATTSNGSITANLADPEPGRPVRLASSNGSITLTMEALRQNDIRANTSNSSITVRLPSQLQANLKARTSNSSITTDYDVTMKGSNSKTSLEGNIGSGGPIIDLETSNGSIRVLKM
jgi:hypothetical protein